MTRVWYKRKIHKIIIDYSKSFLNLFVFLNEIFNRNVNTTNESHSAVSISGNRLNRTIEKSNIIYILSIPSFSDHFNANHYWRFYVFKISHLRTQNNTKSTLYYSFIPIENGFLIILNRLFILNYTYLNHQKSCILQIYVNRSKVRKYCIPAATSMGKFFSSTSINHFFSEQFINMSKLDVVLGSQWGDEGKGKLVDTIGDRYSFQNGWLDIDTIFAAVLREVQMLAIPLSIMARLLPSTLFPLVLYNPRLNASLVTDVSLISSPSLRRFRPWRRSRSILKTGMIQWTKVITVDSLSPTELISCSTSIRFAMESMSWTVVSWRLVLLSVELVQPTLVRWNAMECVWDLWSTGIASRSSTCAFSTSYVAYIFFHS